MLTSSVTRTIPIPHEPGNSLTIRMLSWVHEREAREVREVRALRAVAQLSGDALREIGKIERPASPAETDPLADLDQETVLRHGVVAWDGPDYQMPCTPENVAQLDPETARWAALQIVTLKPEKANGRVYAQATPQ